MRDTGPYSLAVTAEAMAMLFKLLIESGALSPNAASRLVDYVEEHFPDEHSEATVTLLRSAFERGTDAASPPSEGS